jgi:glucose-fructose oxidoreductase
MNRNRRRFLQRSAQATASLGLFSQLPLLGSPRQSKPLGVALLGLGYYSRDLLAPALQLTEHCQLRGIVTGSPEKIPVWQKKYNIPDANVYNYDNLDTIADNDDIDVVYVVTPTGTHMRFSVAAAEAGKHVWCEKPMAMDVTECQRIMDACDKNKVKLSIGYRMQHEPNTQTVMKYADTQPYGAIQNVISEAGFAGSGPTGWRANPALGGGALYDMGVYTINGLRYATGLEPTEVRSAKRTIPNDLEVDVTTTYQLGFSDDILGDAKTSNVEKINLLRVNAANGWYQLTPMQSYTGVQGKTSDGKQLDKPINNQQARQMDNDALAIINDTPVLVPGIEGLKDIRIVNAIIEADKTGKTVKING